MITSLAVRSFLKTLPVWVFLMAGIVVFYEGLPFLNFSPINKIPYIGTVLVGEVDRRVAENEDKWRQRIKDAKIVQDNIEQQAKIDIDNKAAAFRAQRDLLIQQQNLNKDLLNRIIDSESQKEGEIDENGKGVNPLNQFVPPSILHNLRN